MEAAKAAAFREDYGGRPTASKIVYLLTDGFTKDAQRAIEISKDMRNVGITLMIISVGGVDKVQTLEAMAGRKGYFIVDTLAGITSRKLVGRVYSRTGDVGKF